MTRSKEAAEFMIQVPKIETNKSNQTGLSCASVNNSVSGGWEGEAPKKGFLFIPKEYSTDYSWGVESKVLRAVFMFDSPHRHSSSIVDRACSKGKNHTQTHSAWFSLSSVHSIHTDLLLIQSKKCQSLVAEMNERQRVAKVIYDSKVKGSADE